MKNQNTFLGSNGSAPVCAIARAGAFNRPAGDRRGVKRRPSLRSLLSAAGALLAVGLAGTPAPPAATPTADGIASFFAPAARGAIAYVPAGGSINGFVTEGADLRLLGNAYWSIDTTNDWTISKWKLDGTKYDEDDNDTGERWTLYQNHPYDFFMLGGSGEQTITFKNVNVVGNNSSVWYGLFEVHKSSGTATFYLEGSTFSNFRQTNNQYGAIISTGSASNAKGLAVVDGGIAGVTYSGNYSSGDGAGVISVNNSALHLTGKQTFTNNSATWYGGAIGVYGDTTTGNWNASTLDAMNPSAANYPSYSRLTTASDSFITFDGNWAKVFGGAIDLWGQTGGAFFNGTTIFTGNHATGYGGSVTHPSWYGSTNGASDRGVRGGAINIGNEYGIFITEFNGPTTFTGNYADSYHSGTGITGAAFGGAIAAFRNASDATIYRLSLNGPTTFTNNYVYSRNAYAHGGAIYLDAPVISLFINGVTTFTGNYTTTDGTSTTANYLSVARGGAIYLNTGLIEANAYVTFENNRAGSEGGAIYMENGTLRLKGGAVFSGNTQYNDTSNPNNSGKPIERNAIYFGTAGRIEIDTDANESVHFYDPINSASTATGTLYKSGEGTVYFYDYNSPVAMTTDIVGGYFRLVTRETTPGDPNTRTTVTYGRSASEGTFTVHESGAVVGDGGARLQSGKLTIAGGGRALVNNAYGIDATGATADETLFLAELGLSSAARKHVFTIASKDGGALGDGGKLGGHGIIRVENASGALQNVNTTGTFYIDTPDVRDRFLLESKLTGTGTLVKIGAGTFLVHQEQTIGGGVVAREGAIKLLLGGNAAASFPNTTGVTADAVSAADAVANARLVGINPDAATGTVVIHLNGNYEFNRQLTAATRTDVNGRGGALDVNLGSSTNALTFTAGASAFNGTLALSDAAYTLLTHGNANDLRSADLVLGTGAAAVANAGVADLHGLAFNGGSMFFADTSALNNGAGAGGAGVIHSTAVSRIAVTNLDLTGGGTVRVDKSSAGTPPYGDLFAADTTPLLVEDDFGQLRILVTSANPVTGNASALNLVDVDGQSLTINTQSPLRAGAAGGQVGLRYQTLDSTTLSTGPANDGLYLGARLDELEVFAGKTLVISADDIRKDLAGGTTLTAPIVGDGSLTINAGDGNSVTLAPGTRDTAGDLQLVADAAAVTAFPASNKPAFSGATRIESGALIGGANNIIGRSASLFIAAGGEFDTGGFAQMVNNLTGDAGSRLLVRPLAGNTGGVALDLRANADTTFAGVLAGTGNIALTADIDGAHSDASNTTFHTFTLTGANTATGTLAINAGAVAIKPGGSLANSLVDFTGGVNSAKSALDVTTSASTSWTFGGELRGGGTWVKSSTGEVFKRGTVTKHGAGVWTLTGNSPNYTGTFVVSGGDLRLALGERERLGATTGGGLTFAAEDTLPARLTGNGTIGLATGFYPNTVISPGDAGTAGTLSFLNGVSFYGGQYDFGMGAPDTIGQFNDLVTVSGDLSVYGDLIVNLTLLPAGTLADGYYTLFTFDGTLIGDASSFVLGTINTGHADTNDPDNYKIVITAPTNNSPGLVQVLFTAPIPNREQFVYWDAGAATGTDGSHHDDYGVWTHSDPNERSWTNLNAIANDQYTPQNDQWEETSGIAIFSITRGKPTQPYTVILDGQRNGAGSTGDAFLLHDLRFSDGDYTLVANAGEFLAVDDAANAFSVSVGKDTTATVNVPIKNVGTRFEKLKPGTLILGGDQPFLAGAVGTTPAPGAPVNGDIRLLVGSLQFNGGLGVKTPAGTAGTGGDTFRYDGAIDTASGTTLRFAGNTTQTLAGAINGHGSLIKTGGGELVLAGANTFAGPLTIGDDTSANTVRVTGTLGSQGTTWSNYWLKTRYADHAGDITIGAGSSLVFEQPVTLEPPAVWTGVPVSTMTVQVLRGAITGGGELVVANGGGPFASTLVIADPLPAEGASAGDPLPAVTRDFGALRVLDNGYVGIAAVNSTVKVGELSATAGGHIQLADGAQITVTGVATITRGAWLEGTGRVINIGAPLQVKDGGVVAVRTQSGGIGTLHVEGNVSFERAALAVVLGANQAASLMKVTGVLSLNNTTLALTLANDFRAAPGDVWRIAEMGSVAVASAGNGILTDDDDRITVGNYSFRVRVGGTYIELFEPLQIQIPEPATYAFYGAALALGAVTFRRRRRR